MGRKLLKQIRWEQTITYRTEYFITRASLSILNNYYVILKSDVKTILFKCGYIFAGTGGGITEVIKVNENGPSKRLSIEIEKCCT